MRKIKFRAWDKENKFMFEIFDSTTHKDWFLPSWKERYEVMQYTGLKDKNGKEIYEGDIVRYQFDNDDCPFPNKHTEKIIGRIFFSEHRASFSVTAGKNCSSMLNNDLFNYARNGNRVEVIGNIYENPELLEVSTN